MISDKENSVDPTVQTIVEMFPEDFLRSSARETRVVKREREIDVVILFWATALGFGGTFFGYYQRVKTEIRGKSEDHIEHK